MATGTPGIGPKPLQRIGSQDGASRACAWCHGAIRDAARLDAEYCSDRCRWMQYDHNNPRQYKLLLNHEPDGAAFDGATFIPNLDAERLGRQYDRVFTLMSDGIWRTTAEIARALGISESGAGARCRDFRKARNGGWLCPSRRRGSVVGARSGVWEYRLVLRREE